ncbi:DUF6020 family protein [Paenibacillus sp. F4]|uniref:DUF6020 family protein n=1 Tax=Paenibacillus sp. F4 TaxID=357385 RepID=UPI000C9F9CBB|nr:DUF6020 family protein [Paenibacillus sp. F4]PNQ78288.1 hypothetical protein C1T21_25630 [Paenibacillus sp. F4]
MILFNNLTTKINFFCLVLSIALGSGLVHLLTTNVSLIKWLLSIIIVFVSLNHLVISKNLNNLEIKPSLKSWYNYIFCLALTLFLFVSLMGSFFKRGYNLFGFAFISITAFIALFCIVLALTQFLMKSGSGISFVEGRKIKILFFATPSFVIFLVYFLAFYPGVLSPDSLDQWSQIFTGKFDDWHPVAHTWFIMFTTLLGNTPAAFSIIQIIIMSLIIGYCGYTFERYGVKKIFVYSSVIFLTLVPINGIYSITMWKDILYSGLLCLISLYIANIVISNGLWLDSKLNGTLFVIASVGVTLFRHNGFIIFLLTLIISIVVFKKKLMKFYLWSIPVLLIYFIVTIPVFNALKVTSSDPNEALAIPTQQVASVIALDGKMTNEQLEFFANILPINVWKSQYNPYTVDSLKFNKEFNRGFLRENRSEFLKNWLTLCIQNPNIVIKSYLKQVSNVWQITQFNDGVTSLYSTSITENNNSIKYGLSNKIISDGLTENVSRILEFSRNSIIWRAALYNVLIILSIYIIVRRRNYALVIVALPVTLNTLTIMAATPAQDFRYLYANLLVSIVVFLTSFLKFVKKAVH